MKHPVDIEITTMIIISLNVCCWMLDRISGWWIPVWLSRKKEKHVVRFCSNDYWIYMHQYCTKFRVVALRWGFKNRKLIMLFDIMLGRLLTGHSGGSNLVSSPIFVSEISHPDIRGTSSVLTMVLYTSGFFISMLAGAALHWRLATGLFIITGVLSFVLLLFCKVINYIYCHQQDL